MNVLGIIGWSGSGKTTLLECLLQLLVDKGLRVNALKHSHHNVTTEPEGKDSARMRAAGAAEVMLASPFRYVLTRELRATKEPELAELLQRFSPADLTLVEGYKWETFCKLEVYRPALNKLPLYPQDDWVRAVASDAGRPGDAPEGLVWLDLNRPEEVVAWLLDALQNKKFQYLPESP